MKKSVKFDFVQVVTLNVTAFKIIQSIHIARCMINARVHGDDHPTDNRSQFPCELFSTFFPWVSCFVWIDFNKTNLLQNFITLLFNQIVDKVCQKLYVTLTFCIIHIFFI